MPLLPENLVPSQRPPDDQPPFPSVGQSTPTTQVEVYAAAKKEETDPDHERDLALLEEAHERFQTCVLYDQPWRKRATEELDFVDGLKHWTDEQREERRGLPCLEFDKIGPAVAAVVNDARQNPPEAKIAPGGSGADKYTAEIIQGLLRNIDQDSSSQIATMTGYEHACKIGRGWWRVAFEYEHGDIDFEQLQQNPEAAAAAFEQKIVIKRVANPFSVYPDPSAEEFDYSDMKFCFVTEDIDSATFEEQYPEHYAGAGEFSGLSDRQRDEWFPKGAVRIAEYWRVGVTRKRIAQLASGQVMPVEEVPEGAQIINLRWIEKRQVRCAKITGVQVLEDAAWPGKWIPLVPCLGREIIVEGKRRLSGMVRPAMDANLSYDYMRSRQVQAVGLGTIAPYMVAEGAVEGYEQIWNDANRKPVPYLPFKTHDAEGAPIPPPTRPAYEPAIQAITVATQFANEDCKSTLSTYDESLGKRGPAESGIAVNLRQRESDNAHFNYHDNLARSVRHTARIELDLLPHVYSEERLVTIFDPDGSIRQEWINKATKAKDGVDRIYRLGGAARYDVVIGDGPSYATRRAQGSAALMELVRSIPEPMSRALDLVVKAIDAPDMDKLADRLRPPDIQKEQDGDAPDPQQMQQAMTQQGQMIEELTKQVNQLSDIIKTKRIENESKERIAAQGSLAKLLGSEALSKSSVAQTLLKQDHDNFLHQMDKRMELLHMERSVEDDALDRAAAAAGNNPAGEPGAAPPAPAGGAAEQPPPAQDGVRMRAPDGTIAMIPTAAVEHYQSQGAEVVE